ncbi:MAG: hypothetical protein EXS05_00625 [Planctomycetaceae bacterium]|nr:hypothetical protein [Planctomycetaceae bacterium]
MNGMLSVWDALHGGEIRGLGEAGLMWVTQAGLAALPFAVAVLLVNLLCRRWLSAAQMGLLWCLVFVRLLLPAAPASPLSLQNLLLHAVHSGTPADIRNVAVVTAPYEASESQPASGPILSHPTTMPIPTGNWADFVTGMSELLWLAAAVGILAWTLFVHWRFCRRVRRTAICRDERLLGLWDACCAMAGIRSRLPVVVFDGVHQPAVMGLFHPELLLPSNALDLSDDELRMIMLHELAHVRRWDLAINWGLVVLRAVHWWNPIYWIAAARFRSLREQACDAFVVRTAQSQTSRDYSELLLKLAQQAPGGSRWRVMVPASLLGLFESYFRKREIRLRLKALRTAGIRRTRRHKAAFGLVVVLAALCGLTDAETPATQVDNSSPTTRWLLPDSDWNSWGAPTEGDAARGPLEVRVYAIDDVIGQMPPVELKRDEVRREIESLVAMLLERTRTAAERRVASKAAAGDENSPGGSYQWNGERLIVRAPAALHDELATMLSVWETTGPAQIAIECRMLTSPRELATATGIEWQSFGAESTVHDEPISAASSQTGTVVRASSRVEDHLPVFVVPLNNGQVKAITQTAQNDARTSEMFAPKITLFNGQEALVADCVSRPFVVGIEERPGEGMMPRIEVIEEGTKIKLRTVLKEDRRHIQLTGAIELTSIEDVRVISASTADGIRSIQAPRVRKCHIAVASEIEDGQSLLIGCLPSFERKDFFYVVLKVIHLVPTAGEE